LRCKGKPLPPRAKKILKAQAEMESLGMKRATRRKKDIIVYPALEGRYL
jgi:hypothetical protein